MDQKKFIHITSNEIASITHEMFFDYTDEIIGKSNPLHGERSFVLCIIEQITALLKRDSKDDKMIITHIQTLLRASLSHKEYHDFLSTIVPTKVAQYKDLDPISDIERSVLHELIQSNYHEYLMKSDFVSCCYTAMNAFLTTAYCIISEGLNQYISNIDITVDIYDTVIEITLVLTFFSLTSFASITSLSTATSAPLPSRYFFIATAISYARLTGTALPIILYAVLVSSYINLKSSGNPCTLATSLIVIRR